MEQDKKPAAVACSSRSDLLPSDLKEVQDVSEYATGNKSEMEELRKEFQQMGLLKLVWDSKIPEKDKKLYHFFSISASNRENVKEEIKKYLDFYHELCLTACKISGVEEETSDEKRSCGKEKTNETKVGDEEKTGNEEKVGDEEKICNEEKAGDKDKTDDEEKRGNEDEQDEEDNPFFIIFNLYQNLTEMAKAAESGEQTTDSSAVCKLHKKFIAKHEKLESMIKKLECVVLKQELRKAKDRWQQSLKAIEDLRSDLKAAESRYDAMSDRVEILMQHNREVMEQQKALLNDNQTLRQQQQILIELLQQRAKNQQL